MSAEAAEVSDEAKAALNRADGWALVREMLRYAGKRDGQWAGIPMPLPDEELVVEPQYPMSREACDILGATMRKTTDKGEDKPRNVFWSTHYRVDVVTWDAGDGKVDWSAHIGNNAFTLALRTTGCSEAWGIEQEHNALQLLGQHVSHHQMKQYLLTGMFLESSKRSGVTYAFRRLRPTVAIRPDHERGSTRILCTLCLHPIAYYGKSFAGAMCPTDDLLAHLLLMRGDEHMFWRRANQHPAWRPESAL